MEWVGPQPAYNDYADPAPYGIFYSAYFGEHHLGRPGVIAVTHRTKDGKVWLEVRSSPAHSGESMELGDEGIDAALRKLIPRANPSAGVAASTLSAYMLGLFELDRKLNQVGS